MAAGQAPDRMVVECVDISTEGLGICKNTVDAQVVFVPDTYPGEVVDVQITGKKKSITHGSKIQTLKVHDGKCDWYCRHFDRCGGCQLQIVDYEHQLQLKQKIVYNAFSRIGGLKGIGMDSSDSVLMSIEGCEEEYHYRNKVEFSIDSAHSIVGKHIRGSSATLIDVEDCKLQSVGGQMIYEDIRGYLLNEAFLLQEIQYFVIRWSHAYSNALINIITNKDLTVDLKGLADFLAAKHAGRLSGIVNSVSESGRPLEERQIVQAHTVWGRPELLEKVGPCVYRISPNSFFQVNSRQTEKLYEYVLNAAEVSQSDIVLDLYCGAGTISIFLAQRARKVYGVEISESSITDAHYNASLNNVNNIEFIQGDVANVIDMMQCEPPDVVIVDPARKGVSSKALHRILELKSKTIVYVSCHVATQARDIKKIIESGLYEIISIKPFDLFPQTTHIETVVVCRRTNMA